MKETICKIISLLILGGIFFGINPVFTFAQQLNENCTVSVLNRTANVRPDGSWRIDNIPANFGLVKARATCVENGQTTSGQSDFVSIEANIVNGFNSNIQIGVVDPTPSSIAVTSPTTILGSVGEQTQLSVTATFPDGSTQDVTSSSEGTTYTISNPVVANVTPDGLVTAVSSGTVLISATNQGALGMISLQVVLSGDSDGDGIPDDVEIANGLNPNDPVDGLEDTDGDGLSNQIELQLGTSITLSDTDGDGLSDGEEVGLGTSALLVDTDGDGIRDGLEIQTGSDPLDPNSFNLAQALSSIYVSPQSFIMTFNTVIGEASRQLTVTGNLIDGTSLDITSTAKGTNYSSSDLSICNFGSPDGRIFSGQDGNCTITVTNNGFSGISNVTIDSFAPTALSFLTIPEANNVDVKDDYAYVAAGTTGLQVVDVSNRNSPMIVASQDTSGNAIDVKIVGDLAYVADGGGLQILDITAPLNPEIIGAVNTPGNARDVVVKGSLAFVADGVSGLQVIDVSNPFSPSIIGSVDTPVNALGVDVNLNTGIAVVADFSWGIHVIDISNPANPSILGALDTGTAYEVAVHENFVFVADFESSFTSVDISNPSNPVITDVTPMETGGVLLDVELRGNFAFGADIFFLNGVPIIDISNPGSPVPRAILDFSGFGSDNGLGIAVDSRYVYLIGGEFPDHRLYIGQYLSGDNQGISPLVNITLPNSGDTVIEGATIPITVDATDDIQVVSVDILVDGQVVSTDNTFPYEASVTIPSGINSLTLGAEAVDLGGNVGIADEVLLNVVPDPGTTVIGRVVDFNQVPVSGTTVTTLGGVSAVTLSDGTFSLLDVPTVLGNIVVDASATINSLSLVGRSVSLPPVSGGTLDVGDITLLAAFQEMTSGREHICGRFQDGTVSCWGLNLHGQLGNGTQITSGTQVPVTELSNVVSIDSEFSNVCATLSDGTVKCWGRNTFGQLGDGTENDSSIPVQVNGISTAVDVAVGQAHSCALLTDGTVQCWGFNGNGRLGNGTPFDSLTPVSVVGISTAVNIAAGPNHTCAVLSSGTIECWGEGFGNTPVQTLNISTAGKVTGGLNHTCALLNDGSARCWGANNFNQLGNETLSNLGILSAGVPQIVTGVSNAVDIEAGENHTCAALSDGTVKCWGKGDFGQLGDGTTPFSSTVPVSVNGISNAIGVSGGKDHSCANLINGGASCWGSNHSGQLGDGTFVDSPIPVPVSLQIGDPLPPPLFVSLFSPAAEDTVFEGFSVFIAATVSDNLIITSVVFSVNEVDQPPPSELDSPDIHFTVPVGVSALNIDVTVIDNVGRTASDSLTKQVNPDPPPTVEITSPALGATVTDGDIITLSANASDSQSVNGSVVSVEFTVNGATQSPILVPPYSILYTVPLDITSLTIDATATDNLGKTTTVTRTITVLTDPPPNVTITLPQDGITVTEGAPITISANASDNGSVASVVFSLNGVQELPLTTPPYSISAFVPLGVTSLLIEATATDNIGKTATDTRTLNVIPDPGTTVIGRVVDSSQNPISGASVSTLGGVTALTAADGTFNLIGVPTVLGDISVEADATVGGASLFGTSASVPPVSGGTTDVGDITVTQILSRSVAGGGDHTCALIESGSVKCWGGNINGQLGDGTFIDSFIPVPVIGIANAISISAGHNHTCALLSDGTVQCWGDNGFGQLGDGTFADSSIPVSVSGITNALVIEVGGNHTCAVLSDGSVQCWGSNGNGQLGDGTFSSSNVPVSVTGITNATSVSSEIQHTCALLANGTVQCWGLNAFGQLGDGTSTSSSTPVGVIGISNAVAISVGGIHSCAVLSDGTVQCWGYNAFGQLGDGTTNNSSTPVAVPGIMNVSAISGGGHFTCVLLGDGSAKCWGRNSSGQLGDGTQNNYSSPISVIGITSGTNISTGLEHTCVFLSGGTLNCWGSNESGQLGQEPLTFSSLPVKVLGISTAIGVDGGDGNSCALLWDGTVQCWGENDSGQIGNGTFNNSSTPVFVSGISTATGITTSGNHACTILSNGAIQCWGKNSRGQLGDGTNANSPIPVPVTGITGATAISANGDYTCAVLSDGTVKCWGLNFNGQLGNGIFNKTSPFGSNIPVLVSGLSNAIGVASGSRHTCVVLTDGTVQCWGANFVGQLGDGTTNESSIPVPVTGITSAIAVSAGGNHSCALLGDSTVQCWGHNSSGQLGNGSFIGSLTPVSVFGITSATTISTGFDHTCVTLSDGTGNCWGSNFPGQLGDGNNNFNSSPIPVSVSGGTNLNDIKGGSSHTCGLLGDGTIECWGDNSNGQLGNGALGFSSVPLIVDGF